MEKYYQKAKQIVVNDGFGISAVIDQFALSSLSPLTHTTRKQDYMSIMST